MSASQERHASEIQDGNGGTNIGNPVFTCVMTPAIKEAMQTKCQNMLYRTTSSDYGRRPPTFETSPCCFYPKSNQFSEKLRKHGMFRDTSLNTTLDKGKVLDCTNLQRTIV